MSDTRIDKNVAALIIRTSKPRSADNSIHLRHSVIVPQSTNKSNRIRRTHYSVALLIQQIQQSLITIVTTYFYLSIDKHKRMQVIHIFAVLPLHIYFIERYCKYENVFFRKNYHQEERARQVQQRNIRILKIVMKLKIYTYASTETSFFAFSRKSKCVDRVSANTR